MRWVFSMLMVVPLFAWGVEANERSQRTIREATELALMTRTSVGDPPLTKEARKEISFVIWDLLEDYTGASGLRSGIARMVIDNLVVDPDDLIIDAFHPSESIFEGLSGNPVFSVRNGNGRLLTAVKAYPIIGGDVRQPIQQLIAFDLLKDVHLSESVGVHPLALGRARKGERSYALLAMSAAEGDLLTSIIERVGNLEGEEREVSFAGLVQGVIKMARALAEIHTAGKGWQGTVDSYYNTKGKRISARLQEVEGEWNEVREVIATLEASYLENPGIVGYLHGDPHPGNFFFNPSVDRLTVIDTEHMSLSVGANGEPKAPVVFEYVWAQSYLSLIGSYQGLTQGEVSHLLQAFDAAYFSYPEMERPSDETLAYWRLLNWALRVADWSAPKPGKSSGLIEQMKALLPTAMGALEVELEKSKSLLNNRL